MLNTKATLLAVVVIPSILLLASCGGEGGDNSDKAVIDGALAEPNIATAQAWLGGSYSPSSSVINNLKLKNIPKTAGRKINNKLETLQLASKARTTTTYGSNRGTRVYTFEPNTKNKTYTQEFIYSNYDTDEYDEVCGITENLSFDGTIKCSGSYTNAYSNDGGSTRYIFENKSCEYHTYFSNGLTKYDRGGKFSSDFASHMRRRNITYSYNNSLFGKSNYNYFYEENETLKEFTTYLLSGYYHFDNRQQYVTIDESFDTQSNPRIAGLCTNDVTSGKLQLITANNTKMRFTVTDTNTVYVEVGTRGENSIYTWIYLDTFTK